MWRSGTRGDAEEEEEEEEGRWGKGGGGGAPPTAPGGSSPSSSGGWRLAVRPASPCPISGAVVVGLVDGDDGVDVDVEGIPVNLG